MDLVQSIYCRVKQHYAGFQELSIACAKSYSAVPLSRLRHFQVALSCCQPTVLPWAFSPTATKTTLRYSPPSAPCSSPCTLKTTFFSKDKGQIEIDASLTLAISSAFCYFSYSSSVLSLTRFSYPSLSLFAMCSLVFYKLKVNPFTENHLLS